MMLSLAAFMYLLLVLIAASGSDVRSGNQQPHDLQRGHDLQVQHEHELQHKDLCSLQNVFDGDWRYLEPTSPGASSRLGGRSLLRESIPRTPGKAVDRKRGVATHSHNNNPYAGCPITMKKLENTSLFDQIEKFSCFDKTYTQAHFKPRNCHLLSLKYSMQYFYKHMGNSKLIFIGDSLMGQQYISAMCYSEMSRVDLSYDHLGYIHDIFLRDDIPCHDNCTKDKEFLDFYNQSFFNPCWACRDGVRKPFSTFLQRNDSWVYNISGTTKHLVMGTGAWYNVFKGVMNSTLSYMETLNMIGPFIGSRFSKKDKMVFWLDLPPVVFNRSDGNGNGGGNRSKSKESFEWLQYVDKNEMAQRILKPFGFNYLDTSAATRSRKARDANVTVDGVHWCNPGGHAVPTFINQVVFHLMVANHMKFKNNHT